MTKRSLYIIACFLFTIFACKEVIADTQYLFTDFQSMCDNDTESTGGTTEERSFEQEQKLPAETFSIQSIYTHILFENNIYKTPHIPFIYFNIITPPPKAS